MSTNSELKTPTANKKNIAIATAIAAVGAGILAVTIVLPAEYGIDPLGTGEALGLAQLSEVSALETTDEQYRRQTVEFILEPFQSLEYKYHLMQNQGFSYAWKASGELVYDMHAEPHDMVSEADVPSYDVGKGTSSQGNYHAQFTGIHGWFWENQGFEDVVLTVEAAGFFTGSILYRGGDFNEQVIEPQLD